MTDPIKAEPVAYRYAHLDYAGRKVSRYGARAERVNGHDPIEVHPLYTAAQLVEERRLAWNEAIEAAATIADHHRKARRAAHNEAHRRGAKRQATSALGRSLEAQQLMVAIRDLTKDSTHD